MQNFAKQKNYGYNGKLGKDAAQVEDLTAAISRLDDLDATTTASHRAIEAKLDKLIGLLSDGGRAA